MMIYYLLTEDCNLRCSHCIRGKSVKQYMDYSSAVRGLEQIYKLYPDTSLVLSGGEPTLHPRISDLLQKASEKFKAVVINSNGTTPFWQKNHSIINRNNVIVQFSLDGLQDYHDKIRGLGSFDKTSDSIRFINGLGKPIWISTVVSRKNMKSVMRLSEILAQFNIEKWHVSPLMPFGNASADDVPDVNEWNNFVDELINITPFRLGIRKLFATEVLEKLSDEQISQIAESERNADFKNCGCVKSKLYIYPDMTVYGCTCIKDIPLGNLETQSLSEILNGTVAQSFLSYVCEVSACKQCRYFKICNGGCMGMQKKYGYDTRCPLINKLHR